MTKKEKIKEVFLENPEKLNLSKIENFLLTEWFEIIEWKWSHRKIFSPKTKQTYIYAKHNNEVKTIYKKEFLKFYNLNL